MARSQLLESADGFRLSEAIAASGAVLREVGAANSSRLDDYRQTIGTQTAAVLLVEADSDAQGAHAAQPSPGDLASLAQPLRVPVVHDLGAGALVDLTQFGMPRAPMPAESIRAGVDLVLCGGEKLGGPQCGLLLGKRSLIEQIVRHPWARAVQLDRATLAALAATLRLYRQPELARDTIPLLQLSTTSVENLQNRAGRLAPQLAACGAIAESEAVACTLAGQAAESWCIALTASPGRSAAKLASSLRSGSPAVIGREESDHLVLDLRTVFPRQDQQLVDAVSALTKDKT